jgi:hypothetical protein
MQQIFVIRDPDMQGFWYNEQNLASHSYDSEFLKISRHWGFKRFKT